MSHPSQFVGGPCDGELRAVANEPQTLYVPQMPSIPEAIKNPDAPLKIIDHVYEKRAGGFYYEYAGTRTIDLSEDQ